MNKKIKSMEEFPLHITTLSHDGRGIGTLQHKKTFVEGALASEIVTCRLIKKRRSYNEAQVTQILQKATDRVQPPCPHFGVCGGCSLQHMDETSQLAFKQYTLLNQLKHFGQVEPQQILKPLHVNSIGYRSKARLGVRFVFKKNKMLVGFREKSSRYLAELDECVVLQPKVGRQLSTLGELIASLSISQAIPQIEVAMGDNDSALVFRHLAMLSESDQEQLIAFGKKYQHHIYLQPNPPAPLRKLWPADDISRLRFSLPEHQLTFLFHPLDFTQINLELNRLMVNQVIEALDLKKEERILDLFCGIGNFTLPIARQVKSIVGVEGSADMVSRALENAHINHIGNASFYTANLFEPLSNANWLAKYDKVLLDPPRAGAKELLPYIKTLAPNRIVYVSCNPATLARDAQVLVHQYGYQLKAAGIMNMFPHTSHIEAMTIFEQK